MNYLAPALGGHIQTLKFMINLLVIQSFLAKALKCCIILSLPFIIFLLNIMLQLYRIIQLHTPSRSSVGWLSSFLSGSTIPGLQKSSSFTVINCLLLLPRADFIIPSTIFFLNITYSPGCNFSILFLILQLLHWLHLDCISQRQELFLLYIPYSNSSKIFIELNNSIYICWIKFNICDFLGILCLL